MFKVGDRVRCRVALDTKQLIEGKHYTISQVDHLAVKVEPMEIDYWFATSRFEPAGPPPIIGLCGRATAGKDAVAHILAASHGYSIYGWADPLYELALWINPRIWGWRRLSYYVDKLGWTKAKRIPAIREYLQRLGTEGGRHCLHPDVWVMVGEKRIKPPTVITNCRFANEAEWVKSQGGVIVKVTRPGVGACNDHVSEAGEADEYAQYEIVNDGTLVDLTHKVSDMMGVL